jgi:hypothetical protein
MYRSRFLDLGSLVGDDEWSASRPCRFTTGERVTGNSEKAVETYRVVRR